MAKENSDMQGTDLTLVGWSSITAGALWLLGVVSLSLMYLVGGPFGPLNDLLGLLSMLFLLPLTLALYRLNAPQHPLVGAVAFACGVIGIIVFALGSALLLLGRIDFQQSLLPNVGGLGLVGLWVFLSAIMGLGLAARPGWLAWLGIVAGFAMALTLISLLRLDNLVNLLSGSQTGAGPVTYLFIALGLFGYIALPVWFILVGRLILSWPPAGPIAPIVS